MKPCLLAGFSVYYVWKMKTDLSLPIFIDKRNILLHEKAGVVM